MPNCVQEEKRELWSVAAGLFDPFNLGRVTEENCIDAVANIYKEQRFTAASLNDFSELHQSVRYMIEIFYWVVMVFILQYVFDIDIVDYVMPFVSLFLAISFAIASLVGNVFLAFAFVFFMGPYEVGHQVQLGLYNALTPPVAGVVKNITLMYTVITTGRHETVRTVLWRLTYTCYPLRHTAINR
jgi:small-conductance mechanosensitive channel